MADIHKPGATVKTSGIYKLIKEGGGASAFEVTCVEGENFPPRRARLTMKARISDGCRD